MKTVINIKTDQELKSGAKKVAEELGLPLGTIINAYLRELVHEKRVVFSVPELPNLHTEKILENIVNDIKTGKNIEGPFDYKEAIEYLDSK